MAHSHEPIPAEVDRVARRVVDAIYEVHTTLGPGLLESIYQDSLAAELDLRAIRFRAQLGLPVTYKHLTFDRGLRIDFLVGGCVIVEVKSVETILPVHKAQTLSYVRLSGLRLGLLVNFNVALIKDGIRRLVL